MKIRTLAELGAIKKALQDEQRKAAQAAERERERVAREQRERHLFTLTVGEVIPVRGHARAPGKPPPPPTARQRERDEAAVMLEAISDEFDVESLLDTDDALSFRRRDIGEQPGHRLAARRLKIGDCVIELFLGPAGDGHSCAFAGKRAGNFEADAGGGAGHQRGLVGQFQVHDLSPLLPA